MSFYSCLIPPPCISFRMAEPTAHLREPQDWPALPLHDWIDTRDTLHMWLQIAGKVRLRLTPPVNHSWHATFYLTSRGLTTSPIPHGEPVVPD